MVLCARSFGSICKGGGEDALEPSSDDDYGGGGGDYDDLWFWKLERLFLLASEMYSFFSERSALPF